MANYASKVIAIAKAEIGYLEKKNNSNLDSKTGNAGYNNYTKYARDFDTKYPDFYNTPKQSVQWCDMFVDWCFVTAFGEVKARELLGQPKKSCGAGCYYSLGYYKNMGRFFTSNPKVGDQIFFYNSKNTEIGHTGLVYKVDSSKVYTIEGNTSSESGVVSNGGAVARKSYSLSYSLIAGYGRPKYDAEPTAANKASMATASVDTSIKDWQKSAIADGYRFPKFGPDGEWGSECETVAKKAICKKPLVKGLYTNKNLTKFLQKKLGIEADGKYWNDTYNAVVAFQKKNKLTADGVVGINTWKKILKV